MRVERVTEPGQVLTSNTGPTTREQPIGAAQICSVCRI